jgi:hypothetical protein
MKIFPTTADFVVFTKVYTNKIDPNTLSQIEEDGLEYYGMISETQYHPDNYKIQLEEMQNRLNLPNSSIVFHNEDNYPIRIPHINNLMKELDNQYLQLENITEMRYEEYKEHSFLIIQFYKN